MIEFGIVAYLNMYGKNNYKKKSDNLSLFFCYLLIDSFKLYDINTTLAKYISYIFFMFR